MMLREELRKGWCPGALRPMPTGDGLLLRIRPRAGALTLDSLAAMAEVAGRFGSGAIDLTSRANLQLRGLTEATYPAALAALDASGLIDRDAHAEAIRNIVVDPMAGLDPSRIDVRPLASEFEARLAAQSALHDLPDKFGWSFSGCAQSCEGGTAADVRVTAGSHGGLVIRLDGDEATSAHVECENAAGVLCRLAEEFLAVRRDHPHVLRMRDAVVLAGSGGIFRRAGLTPRVQPFGRARTQPAPIGALGPVSEPFAAGIGLPFGRIMADDLAALCRRAAHLGCTEVRVSPWRVLVVPCGGESAVTALLAEAERFGLIVGPADPRLTMDVCVGAPACANATTATRADAERMITALAAIDTKWPPIHVSGCVKGCARRATAALTFVARNGAYDLVRDGSADGVFDRVGIAPKDMAAAARSALTGFAS
ncbi:MAG: precorrin-3B synthase [Hyphomicrobium sp.]